MRAMPARYCMYSSEVSTSRIVVKTPRRKTAGSTAATKGMNTSRDCTMNPMATRELDSESMYRELRAEDSEIVELAAVWSTKCSVVSADINVDCRVASSIARGV